MAIPEMQPDQLRAYAPDTNAPEDFTAFWSSTLEAADALPLDATYAAEETGLSVLETFDVTFCGYGGAPVKAWLHLPANRSPGQQLPAVVQYMGYSGGRGLPHQNTIWAQTGYAHLVMDTRGQGYGALVGETTDPDPSAGAVASPGSMTRGVLDKETYFYRRVFTDAVRAVKAVQLHEAVDAARVLVHGVSQGGGIATAVAGLTAAGPNPVAGTLADVPFLADFPRSLQIAVSGPYTEVSGFLSRHRDKADAVLATLSYFDIVHLGRTARAPALFSAALMDDVCPPSTVFAAFNNYARDAGEPVSKDIEVYPFNNHEGGGEHQVVRQMGWARNLLATSHT